METSGLVYVAGSHAWDKMYKPIPATPRDGFILEEAQGYEDCPMFHEARIAKGMRAILIPIGKKNDRLSCPSSAGRISPKCLATGP